MDRSILVETDFLFGLSARDKLHPYVSKILEMHRRGEVRIIISSASPIEASLTLLSHGIDPGTIIRVLELMNAKLIEYRVKDYAPITLEALAKAMELRGKYGMLAFFDSIHLALAITLDIPLLTSDKVLHEIMKLEGIKRLSYDAVGII